MPGTGTGRSRRSAAHRRLQPELRVGDSESQSCSVSARPWRAVDPPFRRVAAGRRRATAGCASLSRHASWRGRGAEAHALALLSSNNGRYSCRTVRKEHELGMPEAMALSGRGVSAAAGPSLPGKAPSGSRLLLLRGEWAPGKERLRCSRRAATLGGPRGDRQARHPAKSGGGPPRRQPQDSGDRLTRLEADAPLWPPGRRRNRSRQWRGGL